MSDALARRAAAAVVAALLAATPNARGQETVISPGTVVSPAYLSLLSGYAAGDRQAAIVDLAAWPEARLREEITRLAGARQRVRACPACPLADSWDHLPFRAALMLHADAALAERRRGEAARLQESAALELARILSDDPRHAAFVRRWFEATVAIHHTEMRWGPALDWSERALLAFPDSVRVHLVVAAIDEEQGALVTPVPHADGFGDPSGRALRGRLEAEQESRRLYRLARDAARRALAADPASVEAHLRLGRLAWRLGEPDRARRELDNVFSTGQPIALVFLAHLFLGRVAEDASELPDAVRSYEAALAILPDSQSAGVALSQARHRLGDLAGARRALVAGVAAAGHRKAPDPFWEYPFSASRDAEERLAALRAELRP